MKKAFRVSKALSPYALVLIALCVLAISVIPTAAPYDNMGDHALFSEIDSVVASAGNEEGGTLGTGIPVAPYVRWLGTRLNGGASKNTAAGLQWSSLLMALITCVAVMGIAFRVGGHLTALLAGLFLLGNPNYMRAVFAPQTEALVGGVFFLFAGSIILAQRERRWLPLVALLTAMTLGIDHHGPYLLLAAVAALALHGRQRTPMPSTGEFSLGPIPTPLLSCLLIGIILFGLSWSWLHEESSRHLIDYMTSPFGEPHPALLVRGTLWDSSTTGTAPWYVTVDLLFSRLPLIQSISLFLGLALVIPSIWGLSKGGEKDQSHLLPAVLILLAGLFVCALNGSPYYAWGTGYLSVYAPFLALFAGLGAHRLVLACQNQWVTLRRQRVAPVLLAFLFVGPGIIQSARFIPAHGEFIGFLEGGNAAISRGWTTRFPSLPFHPELARWLEQNAGRKHISFLPEFGIYRRHVEMQQEKGHLPVAFKVSRPSDADVVIIPALKQDPTWRDTHRLLKTVKDKEEINIQGQPLYQIYHLREPSR